jgi:hypothetical protein
MPTTPVKINPTHFGPSLLPFPSLLSPTAMNITAPYSRLFPAEAFVQPLTKIEEAYQTLAAESVDVVTRATEWVVASRDRVRRGIPSVVPDIRQARAVTTPLAQLREFVQKFEVELDAMVNLAFQFRAWLQLHGALEHIDTSSRDFAFFSEQLVQVHRVVDAYEADLTLRQSLAAQIERSLEQGAASVSDADSVHTGGSSSERDRELLVLASVVARWKSDAFLDPELLEDLRAALALPPPSSVLGARADADTRRHASMSAKKKKKKLSAKQRIARARQEARDQRRDSFSD